MALAWLGTTYIPLDAVIVLFINLHRLSEGTRKLLQVRHISYPRLPHVQGTEHRYALQQQRATTFRDSLPRALIWNAANQGSL